MVKSDKTILNDKEHFKKSDEIMREYYQLLAEIKGSDTENGKS